MVESKLEKGLLFALQCGWLMYNYDKEINLKSTELKAKDACCPKDKTMKAEENKT